VRVCKQWYSLAIPYLYESVVIGRCRTLQTLLSALQSLRGSENTGHPLGWWSKRLDVAMRDQSNDSESELESLSQIIHFLPNLNILIFRVTIPEYHPLRLPDSFLHQFLRSAGPNLQAILWYTPALAPTSLQWYDLLAGMPHISIVSFANAGKFPEDPLPALPALRILSLPYFMDHFPNTVTSIPSLRHLIFSSYRLPEAAWKTFLLNHGEQLEVIQMHVERGSLDRLLDSISQCCPKLQRLDITIQTWEVLDQLQHGLSLPNTIQTFGIYCIQFQSSRSSHKALFTALRKMKFGPVFKGIQLLCQNNVTHLHEQHRKLLSTNLPELSKLGLEVLDHEGQVLKC
jgi:hypothetical protein